MKKTDALRYPPKFNPLPPVAVKYVIYHVSLFQVELLSGSRVTQYLNIYVLHSHSIKDELVQITTKLSIE